MTKLSCTDVSSERSAGFALVLAEPPGRLAGWCASRSAGSSRAARSLVPPVTTWREAIRRCCRGFATPVSSSSGVEARSAFNATHQRKPRIWAKSQSIATQSGNRYGATLGGT